MRARGRSTCAAAILVILTCTCGKREEPTISTREMATELTRDVRASQGELQALEDSLDRSLGDSVAGSLHRADAAWEQYRRQECDAIRLAFAGGSEAPIAHLECWVALTDDRRRFLGHEYNFAR